MEIGNTKPVRNDPRFSLEPHEIEFTESERAFLNTLSIEQDNDSQILVYTNSEELTDQQAELIELSFPHQYVGFQRDNDNMIYAVVDGDKGV